MTSTTLPPELWLIVADLLRDAIINPADHCNYLNFPQIDHYLRCPTVCSSLITAHRQLRLVCRAFNELFKSPPQFFMKKPIDSIPQGTRALYITSMTQPLGCLDRLLEDRSASHRISTLDMACEISGRLKGIPSFDYICSISHLLPGVRNLTLIVHMHTRRDINLDFWTRLNNSFSELVILVLRKFVVRFSCRLPFSLRVIGAVSFEKIQILDVDQLDINHGLYFPSLRHVAFGWWSWDMERIVSRAPQLESLLIRGACYGGTRYGPALGVDPNQVPGLKLLGLPMVDDGNALPPLPNYPVHHLCLHVPVVLGLGRHLVDLVKQVSVRLPELSQITLDLTEASEEHRSCVESVFRCVDPDLRPSGLRIKQLLSSSHIIIERSEQFPTE